MSSGGCARSLVLLPGTLCDERVFAPMVEALERRGGDGWEMLFGPTHLASTLEEAAQQVLAEAPAEFALVGFSLGGIIALRTALLAPERVQGIALLGATAAPVAAERHAGRRAAVEWAREHGAGALVGDKLWSAYVSGARVGDAGMRGLLRAMADDLGAEALHRQTELALARPDLRPSLGSLTMPALVLGGTEDGINPPATQRELASGLGSTRLALVEGAGHFMLLEEPDEVARHVGAWLDAVARNPREFQ